MADQIKEGAPAEPEPEVVAEQPPVEEQQAPAEEGAEETVVAEPEAQEQAEEAAPAEETQPVAEAPKQDERPVITKEIADEVANWRVWQTILERNPALKAQAQAEYQRMAAPQQQAPQQPQDVSEADLKAQYNQLIEQGKVYEANRLLVTYDPRVQRAEATVAQLERAEHAKNLEGAKKEIAQHQASFGQLEPEVRQEMTEMYAGGYKGDLVSARVAVLVRQGRLTEATNLLSKAAKAAPAKAPHKSVSVAAGGRVPAAAGAPAPRRVAKPQPTPGSGFTSEEVDWIAKREQERGGHL